MKRIMISSLAVIIAFVVFAFTKNMQHPQCPITTDLFWFKVNSANVTCAALALGDISEVPSTGALQIDAEGDFNNTSFSTFATANDLEEECPGDVPPACYVGYTFAQLTRVKIQSNPDVFVWRPTSVQTKTCCITRAETP